MLSLCDAKQEMINCEVAFCLGKVCRDFKFCALQYDCVVDVHDTLPGRQQ